MAHSLNPGYIPGDYWMVCDVCGFDYRWSQMRKRWDGAWVCAKDWEPHNPQDFVKARKEKIAVPVARPSQVDFTNSTTLAVAGVIGDLTITVASATSISDEDSIGIGLDDGTVQWTTVNGDPVGALVTLTGSLIDEAAIGNTVYTVGDSFSAPKTTTAHL